MPTTATHTETFAAADGATPIPFDFQAASAEEVGVLREGVELTYAIDYSVEVNGDGTGTVTPLYSWGNDAIIVFSKPNFEQPANFSRFSPLYPDQIVPPLDRLARGQLALARDVGRSLRIGVGDTIAELPTDRGGMFLAFDASGDPIASSGAGADAALRTDLAKASGALLVGLEEGGSVEDYVASTPRRLTYGKRVPIRTVRKALEALDTLHTEIVGDAAYAGITGGFGFDQYYVNNPSFDSSIQYSLGWALKQAKDAGGGQIYFDPLGRFDVLIHDKTSFQLLPGEDNITVYAPGRNVTFWQDRLDGTVSIWGENVIFQNIYFRVLPGPMNETSIGADVSNAASLVNCNSIDATKLAFVGCEFRHPSWHCLDITSAALAGGEPECRATIQDCIFWDAIQAHLFGAIDNASGDLSTRQTFVTLYNCIYAYCSQRNPKALGNARVEMVDCYSILQDYETEVPPPTAEFTFAYGAAVQNGGHLRARGCLWQSSNPLSDGREATRLNVNPISGATGYIEVIDCAAENDLVINERNPDDIAEIPFVLDHTPVPAAGASREAWVADRLARAGARIDAAPDGMFKWVEGSATYPNGETILIDRTRRDAGRWERTDTLTEYAAVVAKNADGGVDATPRDATRVVGRENGTGVGELIEPAILDITGLNSGYFALSGLNAAPTLNPVRDIVSQAEGQLVDGMRLEIFGTSATPLALKSAVTISATGVDAADDELTVPAHGRTASGFQVTVANNGGALPAGLAALTRYYGVFVDADTIKLAPTYEDALAETNLIDITDAGSGTQRITIGNLNLPGGRDIVLDSNAKVVSLKLNTANLQFHVEGGTFNTDSGVAAPVLAAVANVSGAPTVTAHKWTRIGNVVRGTLRVQVTPTTTATVTTLSFTLPVASVFTDSADMSGVGGVINSGSNAIAFAKGDVAGGLGLIEFTSTGVGAHNVVVNYAYEVK